MNRKYSSLILVEPSDLLKRDRSVGRFFTPDKKNETGGIKEKLKEIRQACIDNMAFLPNRFLNSVKNDMDGLFYANDGKTAAKYIAQVASPHKAIAINASNTVWEIEGELKKIGVNFFDTYMQQFVEEIESPKRFWEFPSVPLPIIWESFISKSLADDSAPVKDIVALFGINAAAAEDGSLFLFQHSRNVGLLAQEAKKLIFLVPINKILENRGDALFQTMCVGAFGIIGQLLKLGMRKSEETRPDLPGYSTEVDSASREIHVVLLDNGRTEIQKGKYKDLLSCIGCRACRRKCPTFPFYSPEGKSYPRNYLWDFLEGRGVSVELCTQCGSCKLECPVGIDTPRLILEARNEHPPGFWEGRTNRAIIRFPDLMEAARPIAGLANRINKNRLVKLVSEKMVGLSKNRQLPALQSKTFAQWFRGRPVRASVREIVYYPGCFVNFVEPEIGKAVVRILEKTNHQVLIPNHLCCGMSRIGTGELRGARQMADKLIDELYPYAAQGYEILFTCPSCGLSLRHEYTWLLDDPRVGLVARKTRNLCEYLFRLSQRGELILEFKKAAASVYYHTPCHLHAQGGSEDAVELLKLIPGLSVLALDRGCCGMSGTFGLKAKFYERSRQMAAPLLEGIKDAKTDYVATDCAACAMQIREGTEREVVHPICLLDRFAS